MYILVKKGMLSAYGEIFRKGDVLELEEEVAERLLESEDFEACEEPVVIEPEDDTESEDDTEPEDDTESEDDTEPEDDTENIDEEKQITKSTAKKTATKKTSSKRTQKSTVKKDAELPSVDFEAAVKK